MATQKEIAALFAKYHKAKAAEAEAKTLGGQIKALIAEMGAKEGLTAGGHTAKVTWAAGAMKFDEKRFAAEHPDLYERYRYHGAPTARLYFK